VADVGLIGKEANSLDEAESGLVDDWDEVRNVYRDPSRGQWDAAIAVLATVSRGEAAAQDGPEGHCENIHPSPHCEI
jgi:hypothetical protein